MKIKEVRPILLSCPYSDINKNFEVIKHLNSGYKTIGLVEIKLENGLKGYGEGYLAVFAPKVFTEIVNLISPYLIGEDCKNTKKLIEKIKLITGYWSYQGAAQHVISAIDIAIFDCVAQIQGIPLFKLLNKNSKNSIELYGSGGDSISPEFIDEEFNYLESLGISNFKIRARRSDIYKSRYVLRKGKSKGVKIAIDMTQNLSIPGNTVNEVIEFFSKIQDQIHYELLFMEEVFGIEGLDNYASLKNKLSVKLAGGEIVTNTYDMKLRIDKHLYDIVQPDASVIGGITAVNEIFNLCNNKKSDVYVHTWGGPVSMLANYHVAIANEGKMAEWPMPKYNVRNELVKNPWEILNGKLIISDQPGLGIYLTNEIENKYKFRENSFYNCIGDDSKFIDDKIWQ